MPVIRATIQLDVDGQPWPGFPVTLRQAVTVIQSFDYAVAAGAAFVDLPISQMDPINVFVLRTDRNDTDVGNTTPPIELNRGGLILIIGANMDNSPVTAIRYNPGDSSSVQITGLAAGIP